VSLLPVMSGKSGGGGTGPANNNTRIIMSWLKISRVSGQLLFLAAATVVVAASGADAVRTGYLAVVGPPNLRFAAAGVREKITPTRYYSGDTNLAETETWSAATATNTVKVFLPATNAAPVAADVMKFASTPVPTSPMMNFSTGGADSALVTSQMLVDYLKPSGPGRDNHDREPAVVVPVNLGFTPPTLAPQNTSQATYSTP